AVHWFDELRQIGFRPLLADSNGAGGFHLRVLLREPAPTVEVYVFFAWLTGDYARFGFPKRPECFPKQRQGAPAGRSGQYGNWLRLPGRHHSREHWSRFWDGQRWLEGEAAVAWLLSFEGDRPELLLRPAIEKYAAKLPNLGEAQGRDDVAYQFAC